MISLAMVLSLAVQDPDPAPPPKPRPEAQPATPSEPAARPVAEWSDKAARAAVKEFEKALKGKKVAMRDKLQALEALALGSNKALVKPLSKLIIAERSIEVRKRAATILGNQPAKQATKAILTLLANPKLASQPAVLAELIRALNSAGYTPAMWGKIDRLFERNYGPEYIPLHKALLELIAQQREVAAWPLLLRNLDEPAPSDPDSPSNPPAEYWEARWKSWQAFRGDVKEAIFAVAGQRFSTAAEALAWAHKNGDKLRR